MTDETRLQAEKNMREILGIFDEPDREGLLETPKRYIKFLEQFLNHEPFNFTDFNSEKYDEMVIVKDIPFFSLCEHHLAPFFGTADVAYIPNGRIVGLSKIPRCVDHYANRFQNQERITQQIADKIQSELTPLGVAVRLTARHMCVEMRGVKKHNCNTVTTALRGTFKSDIATRAEFFNQLK